MAVSAQEKEHDKKNIPVMQTILFIPDRAGLLEQVDPAAYDGN